MVDYLGIEPIIQRMVDMIGREYSTQLGTTKGVIAQTAAIKELKDLKLKDPAVFDYEAEEADLKNQEASFTILPGEPTEIEEQFATQTHFTNFINISVICYGLNEPKQARYRVYRHIKTLLDFFGDDTGSNTNYQLEGLVSYVKPLTVDWNFSPADMYPFLTEGYMGGQINYEVKYLDTK